MIKYLKRIDVAYLPNLKDNIFEHEYDVNKAYEFTTKYQCRAFCTHFELLPLIQNIQPNVKMSCVIDFPKGCSPTFWKIFMAGRAFELLRHSNQSEIDVVLHPETNPYAMEDLMYFTLSHMHDYFGIKYIVELGLRPKDEVRKLVHLIDTYKSGKYIKTNTGKMGSITFEEKLGLVGWLYKQTKIPIKVSGGVTLDHIDKYTHVTNKHTIFGMSYDRLKDQL